MWFGVVCGCRTGRGTFRIGVVMVLWGGVLIMTLTGSLQSQAKTCSRFVTAAMRANVLRHAEAHSWVAAHREAASSQAEQWLARSDDELWALVPSQELPRGIMTNVGVLYQGKKAGCPSCGDGITPYGNYPWKTDVWHRPWTITCPNCAAVYPKNDFYAFYQTALDEHGMFRRELGDRSLLFNAEHPNPDDPLHKVFVDDGYGMLDEKGNTHHAIPYFVQWGLWRSLRIGVSALAQAFALTSDRRYAHKAAVLLDRIADVYPDMDFLPLHRMGFQHSQGGSGRGRIEGCIWETRVGSGFARSYDVIFDGIQDDRELVDFCSRQATQYGLGDKSSIAGICRHVEDHLLLEILASCKDGRIAGNTGMTHTCLATTAIALDRPGVTEQWLDWLFDPGFPGELARKKDPVPWVLVQGLDRDGMGGECGGYGLLWVRGMQDLAEILTAYPGYTRHDVVRDYPKLKQTFFIQPRLQCLDAVMPPIGDSSSTGNWGREGRPETFVKGFKLYGDQRLAELAWRYADGVRSRLLSADDIFESDPEATARQIAEIATTKPYLLRSEHLGRYGQAVLQTEDAADGRAVWIHYGYGKGHSHRDCLNLGLYAKNLDMLPDLGYPEYTGSWPKRGAWTSNTVSHNTLLVGDAPSGYSPGGRIGLFAVRLPLRVMQVSSKTAYEGMRAYNRTVLHVDVSAQDSYVLDVFRARGGSNHRLSYHGPGATVTVAGLALTKQETGTLAGPDVPFATLSGPEADVYRRTGFTYLYDVECSSGPVSDSFTVDWKGEDLRGRIKPGQDPHLRLHALTACDEVALASGDPPQNKRGNPRRLRYLLQSRLGDDVDSQFINVLEPYDRTPFVRRVRQLEITAADEATRVAAVSVELMDGTTDAIICCEQPARVSVEGGIELDGRIGFVRFVAGEVRSVRLVGGTYLRVKGIELTAASAAYEGRVVRVDVQDPSDNRVYLDPPLPEDAPVVGATIHFVNDLPWDTSFVIKRVGKGWVSTGDITLVAGFQNAADLESGYRYHTNAGDAYSVPTSVALDR